jgi:hypothetical protein
MYQTRTITGTDDRGRPASATVVTTEDDPTPAPEPTPEPASSPAMLVGTTTTVGDWSSRLTTYPGVQLCRVFGQPGSGIPSWGVEGQPGKLDAMPSTITPFVSFKDWASDSAAAAMVNSHLDGLPADRREWLAWHHEPEQEWASNVAEYRRRWCLLSEVVAAHHAGDRVQLVPIQTLQWTAATGTGKGNGNYSTFATGVGLPGMDCYADSWADKYPVPAPWLAPALKLADAMGRPLVVPELGAIKMPSDPTGARRADWIRAVVSLLRSEGAAAVLWWDALGANSRDFRLDDSASRTAWNEALAGRV